MSAKFIHALWWLVLAFCVENICKPYTNRVINTPMKLSLYIKNIGDEAAAALFNVEVRTAASWRLGERHPRPKKAREIVLLTGGDVSFADIYEPLDVGERASVAAS